jgi:NADPH:quinone reductase-like Zn-dependent oxidoreductase
MRALRFYEYGGPEVLRLEDDVPVPEAGEGQVLIKVAGAGVNPVDWKIREGLMKNFAPVTFPATVGREFSGTVEKLGPGVSDFSVGDEVYGIADGSCADFVVANVDATGLRPASMDAADAGGVALTSMTAWQALFDNGGLKPGMKVLIQSASGGVGTFAVQIAKWGGAHVIGTCSAANAHLVQELGADEIIDYKSEDYAELLSDIDLVIETSPQNMQKSLGILKPGGTLVSLVGPPPKEEGKNSKGMSMQPKREQLSQISDLIEDLKIRPVIDTVVPFSRAIDLQNEVQKGHTVGKVVVRLSE